MSRSHALRFDLFRLTGLAHLQLLARGPATDAAPTDASVAGADTGRPQFSPPWGRLAIEVHQGRRGRAVRIDPFLMRELSVRQSLCSGEPAQKHLETIQNLEARCRSSPSRKAN